MIRSLGNDDLALGHRCGMLRPHVARFTRTNRVLRSSATVLRAAGLFLLFASVCPACALNRSDFPLSHKHSREISIRASEIVMINRGTALLSTAAVRYAWCSQLVPAAQSPPRTLPSSRSMLHPCPVACRTHTRVRHTRLPERCAGGIEG